MHTVILDAATTDMGDESLWCGLAELGTLAIHPRTAPAEVVPRLAEAEIVLTNKVRLDDRILSQCPGIRYIGVLATGYNVIDIDSARQRQIAVANVPGYSTASVAQHVFALLLHASNDVAGHHADVMAGRWATAGDFCFTRQVLIELAGKTIAVVGSGAIGQAVGRIAEAFGMRILRCAVPGSASPARTPLTEALPQADVVTLHCPLTPRTEGLVDEAFLAAMKPGSVLINTGRGQLIDEAALLAALRLGRIGRVCLDVLAQEPPGSGHPLLDAQAPWSSRLIVTPHLAWATVEARTRLVGEAVANLNAFLCGQARNRVV